MAVIAPPLSVGDFALSAGERRDNSRGRPSGVMVPVGLVVLTLVAQPHLLAPDTLVSLDSASQFFPWYAFMGETLRAGHIPGWNPATFSGTPFAANPLLGWTYVPAMLLFTLLPLSLAAKAYLLFHPLFAAWISYALARALGLTRLGAFVAALAYATVAFCRSRTRAVSRSRACMPGCHWRSS